MVGRGDVTIAVLTDIWPSASEPHSGTFVQAQVEALAGLHRQVVLVPRLVLPGAHARVWGRAVQGWQRGWATPPPPNRLLRYPMLRIPRLGEAEARAAGSLAALRLAGEHPALVHAHFLFEVGVGAVAVARRLRVGAVITVHGTDGRWLVGGGVQPRFRRRMLDAARAARRLVVVEQGLAERIVDAGVPAERVVVLPMGVDERVFDVRPRAEARRELGIAEDARLVLFVGRPTPEKGIEVLERALLRLGPSVECVAVGPAGPGGGAIRWVGQQAPAAVSRWLAAADLLCLPSFDEGSPVSVAEALACGRPVVASRVGGVPRQVEDGATGILVPPGDADALAEALAAALARSWSPEELRRSSRPFWWSTVAPRLLELYAELV